jgi:ribosomal protein RSM22 (predicted rRNA methylase)
MKLRVMKQFLNSLSNEDWGDTEVIVQEGTSDGSRLIEDVRKEEVSSALHPKTAKWIVIRI